MTPNTLRIALGLIVLGVAPAGLVAFPQQALSDANSPKQELLAGSHMAAPAEMDMDAAEMDMMETEVMGTDAEMTEVEEVAVDATTMTIAELAASDENFGILTAALEVADLVDTLNSDEISVTVFAPTNDAFAALPEGTVEALLLPENRDQLVQLLTYHVVNGEVRSTDLSTGNVETMAGPSISVMVGDEMVTINQANVVLADIEASNGIIHVIDAVLLPM